MNAARNITHAAQPVTRKIVLLRKFYEHVMLRKKKGKVPIATVDLTASSLRWHMKKVSSKIDKNNFQCFCGRTLEKFEHEILPGSTESTADPEDNSA